MKNVVQQSVPILHQVKSMAILAVNLLVGLCSLKLRFEGIFNIKWKCFNEACIIKEN